MAGQSFGETFERFFAGDLAYGKRVIPDDDGARQSDIGLGRPSLLVRPCEPQQIPVEFLPAAVKIFNRISRS